MGEFDNQIDKELFLENFEKLSLKMEQLTSEVSQMKHKLDKINKYNRSFGLETIKNSASLDFAKDIHGISSPSKRYILSLRAVSEMWKGRRNDILISIRQYDLDKKQDLKALGIRIPITDIKTIQQLTREITSLLYIACELKGIDTTLIFREILEDINKNRDKMLDEIKSKMEL